LYATDYHAGHTGDPKRVAIKTSQARDRAAWLLSRRREATSAFEIGCGEGALLAELARAGLSVSGVEPGAEYASFGRECFGGMRIEEIEVGVNLRVLARVRAGQAREWGRSCPLAAYRIYAYARRQN
jgi:SAM-dependent methyltransferase